MNITIGRALRAMAVLAMLLILGLAVHTTARAQDGTYDVKVMTPAEGKNGELPLNYTIHYSDGTQQDISVTAEGRQSYTLPAPGTDLTSVTFNGVDYPFTAAGNSYIIPWLGGCWKLCVRFSWNWWWPRWYFFWYWDPCC